MTKCLQCGNDPARYGSLFDVIECKGRIGDRGSWRERLAFWIARNVTSALMRDPQIRKEITLAIGFDMRTFLATFPQNPPPVDEGK